MTSVDSVSSLLSRTTLDDHDHEAILKAANNELKKSKRNTEAQRTRVVALLKLDRFEDAQRAFEDGGPMLEKDAELELAYTLYKNGRYEEAEKVASLKKTNRGLRHVEAQTAYRLEHFSRTQDVYQELSARMSPVENEENDLRINKGATNAQILYTGRNDFSNRSRHAREDLEQFETSFNAACAYVAQGQLKHAEQLLKIAKDLCNATEGLSNEEKQEELLPITIQQLYVMTRLGKRREAEELASSLSTSHISDPATQKIANTNILAAKSTPNPYLAHRIFNSVSKFTSKEKPFEFQKSILQHDSLALDLKAGKRAHRVDSENQPGSLLDSAPNGVFKAAAQAHSETDKAAIREILPLLERYPTDVGLVLTVVQLYCLVDKTDLAVTLLESFLSRLERSSTEVDQDVRYTPGLVALIVSLYGRLNRTSHENAELAKAASYWRHRSKNASQSTTLMTSAATSLLESHTEEDLSTARAIFETLAQTGTADTLVNAGLAASAADVQIVQDCQGLPAVNHLIDGTDITSLEDAGAVRPTAVSLSETSKKRPAVERGSKSSKSKAIRTSKMPKEFDPSKKPDPERWLPLRDRSYWKPKGKKKGKAAGGGMSMQGVVVSEEGSRPDTSGQSQSQQHQKPGGGGKAKKKGKGR